MKSRKITFVIVALGAATGLVTPLDEAIVESNALEACVVTAFFLLGMPLARTAEWMARGMATFLIKVANRHAQLGWKWQNHRLLIGFGFFLLGLAFGLWSKGLLDGVDTRWPGATAAGAGIGLIAGEHLARCLFRISKEDIS